MMRIFLILTLLCGSSACAFTFELIESDSFTRRAEERSPTGESVQAMEYFANRDGTNFQCLFTTRSIDRSRTVTQTYRRRQGLSKGWYTGGAVGDAIGIGLVAGSIMAICAQDGIDSGCWWTLAASPFAVDLIYALIRRKGAMNPVLVSKEATQDVASVNPNPIRQEPTDCSSVQSIHLGHTEIGDQGKRGLMEGAYLIERSREDGLSLSSDALIAWIEFRDKRIWVLDTEGEAHPVQQINRCDLLRRNEALIPLEHIAAFQATCPSPVQQPTSGSGQESQVDGQEPPVEVEPPAAPY